MAEGISTREAGTFLHEIDQHFNPYAPLGGVRDKAVFFVDGTKIEKTYYYDYRLREARIADMLCEHFYDHFDIIAYFGPRPEGEGMRDEEFGRLGLYLMKGADVFRNLRRAAAEKPYTSREFTELGLPENPLMRQKTLELWDDYDEAMTAADRALEERFWFFEDAPSDMIEVLDRKVFSGSGAKALLVLDDYANWSDQINASMLRRFKRWCTSAEFLKRGHSVIFLMKQPLDPGSDDVVTRRLAEHLLHTDNAQRIALHDHTREEIRRYLLLRNFTNTLPFPSADVERIAGTLEIGARNSPSFGIEELKRKLTSVAWPRYIAAMGGQAFDPAQIDLEGLRDHLARNMIGQKRAKEWVLKEVERLKKWGLPKGRQRSRPLIRGLFAGPSGVGKTELARQVSRFVFNKPALIIPLSEYVEEHRVSKLIGAPPGYVGHGETTELEKYLLHDEPRGVGVVVLDEFEKCHERVRLFFMNILEEGVASTGGGRQIGFGNTFVFATTNAGSHADAQLGEGRSLEERELLYMQEIRHVFPPELMSRLAQILVFDWFTDEERAEIAKLYLRLKSKQLSQERPVAEGFDLAPTESFLEEFVKRIPKSVGARGIRVKAEPVVEDAFDLYIDHVLKPPVELDWPTDGDRAEVSGFPLEILF